MIRMQRLADVTPEEFIEEVRAQIEAYGLSQGKLAAAAGIQPQHLSKYMQGKVAPSLRTMVRLYDAMTDLINRAWEGNV